MKSTAENLSSPTTSSSSSPPPAPPSSSSQRPDFVGVEELKRLHREQIELFEDWARSGQWELFHLNHFDWWAFPINEESSHGLRFTVYEEEISQLKEDPLFMENYRKGLALIAASWGWDIYRTEELPYQSLSYSQRWRASANTTTNTK